MNSPVELKTPLINDVCPSFLCIMYSPKASLHTPHVMNVVACISGFSPKECGVGINVYICENECHDRV